MVSFGVGSYWGPIVASVIMLVGAGVAWLFASWSRKTAPQNPTEDKLTTYACGENVVQERKTASDIEVQETRPHGELFFSPIREVFKGFYDRIRSGHTGDLSTYLVWLVFGIVILIVLIWVIYITGL
jgi:uncharacterized membrane protein